MQGFSTGTLAGAGSFRCEVCDFPVALHELDEVPACPGCGGRSFRRSSMFDEGLEVSLPPAEEPPDWLNDAREALVEGGDYLAFEDDDRVQVIPLQEGWTRVGRSLSAHIRFDDPTVSRRHALIYCDDAGARVLDDRSLNGVFLNGERVELDALKDGDEIHIGRFRLFFVSLSGNEGGGTPAPEGVGSAVG